MIRHVITSALAHSNASAGRAAAAIGRPPDADHRHLAAMFTAIDRDRDAMPHFEDWHTPDHDPVVGTEPTEHAGPRLTSPLADVLPRPGDDADRAQWIATSAAVVDARIHAIVSGKHRRAYARAAFLAFAHAETLAAIGRPADAHTYLAEVRARFPRHVAFRGELRRSRSHLHPHHPIHAPTLSRRPQPPARRRR